MSDRSTRTSRVDPRLTVLLTVLALLAGLLAVVPPPLQAQAAAPGLVGRWAFDAGTGTTATDSVGGKTLTLGTGAGWVSPGVQGASALTANGSGTGNAVTSATVLNTSSSFTVAAYVKLNNLSGYQTIVSQDGAVASGFFFGLRGDNGRLSFAKLVSDTANAASTVAAAGSAPVVGQWYHLTGVYNSTANTMALYLNGRLQSTVTAPAPWSATGNLVVGRGKFNSGNVDYFNGTVDDVRVYNQALSASDVSHLGEAAHWNFDEGTGTTAADDSLSSFNGTLTNGPTWGPGPVGTSSIVLAGNNDTVDTSNSVFDTSKSFSVTAWARPDVLTFSRTVASIDGANLSGFQIQLRGDGKWGFLRGASDTAAPVLTSAVSTTSATAGTWYQLTAIYNSVAQTMSLYVNGVLENTVSFTTGYRSTGNFEIGRGQYGASPVNYFQGGIDDVRVFPYVLEPATVTALAVAAPPQPAAPTATSLGSTIAVSWVAPAPIAGAPVTGYSVTPYVNGVAGSAFNTNSTATSQNFTGAVAGTSYRYTVAAINANGTSAPSGQSNAAVGYSVPGAPTITAVSATGSSTANLTWSAPSSDGSNAITGYRVTPYVGSTAQATQTFAAGSAGTAQSVTGLSPGITYTFKVAAQNAAGYGADSAASSAVTTAATSPSTMAAPTAVAGNASAAVSWVAPAANGSAITGYLVTPYIGATAQTPQSFASTATTQQVTGLTNGTAYTFTVSAVNAIGTGTASPASAAVTPYTVPGAPSITAVAAAAQSATLTWSAPASNGGNAITGYRVTPYVSGVAQSVVSFGAGAAGSAQTIGGLTAGKSYTFTVAAQNAAGFGAESAASTAVTPTAQAPTSSPPQATQGGAFSFQFSTAGYTAPYVFAVSDGSLPPGLTLSTGGLLSGTPTAAGPYVWTVRVTDANGVTSRTVTEVVAATPVVTFAPTAGVVGTAYSAQPTVAGGTGPFVWTVPTGSLPGGLTMNTTTGLVSGTPTTVGSFAVTVRATDANSVAANRAVTFVITDKPSVVATPTATAGLTSAVLTWVAPAANGSTITGYVITPYLGGVAQTVINVDPSAKTRTLNGLTAGGIYTFTVAATNVNGTSTASPVSNPVTPYAALSAPTISATAAGDGQATVTWTAPTSNGGATITGYVVTPYIGAVAQTPQTFASAATTQTVTGLTPGTAYTFKVAATNTSGANVLYRIDAGGPGAAALDGGPAWAADSAVDNPLRTSGSNASGNYGAINGVDSSVPGTTPLSIYQIERWDPAGGTDLQWSFPVTSGTPTLVRMYFADSYFSQPGQRSFDVALEGTTVLPSFDVIAAAGARKTGTMREFAVTSDGSININFSRLQDNPLINGIEIIQTGTATTGPPSASSSAVTPNASPTLTFAAPPVARIGVAYSQQLPVNDGTAPFAWSVTTGTLPAGITLSSGGLLSGTPTTLGSSTFTVQVLDASGQSATRSVTLVVADIPSVPATPAATAGLTSAVLSWVAPAANGSPITSYAITPYLGGVAQSVITVDPSAKTRTLNGLTAGGIYTFSIAATNAAGTSAASSVSNAVTPYAALNAPVITATAAGDSAVTLTWTAPTSNGGATITGYVVTPFIGSVAQTPQSFASAATTQTITGLTPGTAYTFKVAATNNSGTSVLYRIAAGGALQAAIDGGPDWQADNAFGATAYHTASNYSSWGAIGSVDSTVPASTPLGIFRAERWDPAGDPELSWTFPVTSGTPVKVRLYFANQYPGSATVGSRVFDVSLDGSTVLPSFDSITAAGGSGIGTMREFAVTSDGTVNIDFAHGPASDPNINGIEIIQTGTAATGPPSASSTTVSPNASPSLSFAAPPAASLGVAYSQQLTVDNGTAPFTWSVASGTLPAGITLSSGGLLSGTPTALGTFNFTVQVSDGDGQTATRAVALVVNDKPATPAAPTATAGVTSATVTWVAPASNNSPITGYVVTPYKAGVAQTAVSYDASATTRTLTGLTAGSVYTFTVSAVNAVGTSTASAQSNTVVPYAVPAAPVITSATASTSGANLTWTAPAANGSPITGYIVTPYIGATAQATQSFSGSTTTAVITGLTPGTAYTFTVTAVNTAGSGPASAPSTTVTPNASPTLTFAAPPPAPLGVAYSQQLPVNGGTAPFTWSVTTGTLPAGITLSSGGLLSGTPTTVGSSTFTVQVSDAAGQTATRSVTLVVNNKPATPAAPTATAGVTSATVTWVAPANNNSAITGYVVTPYKAGVAQTAVSYDASATTRTLTGLTAGSVYTFTVAAVNAVGTSTASAPSNTVVPYDVPGAPVITSTTPSDSGAYLYWNAAATNGSAITGYVVTTYIGSTVQGTRPLSGTTTAALMTGLTPGTAYTFTVTAANAAGSGPASAPSSAVTPNASPTLTFAAPPPAPLGVAYSQQLPVNNGTAPFTWSVTTGTLPAGITLSSGGLLSGTPTTVGSSTFTVQVSDAAGQTATRSVTLVVNNKPATPAAPTATAGVTSATVTWVAPASNNSPITGYVVTPYKAGVAQTSVSFDASATTRTLSGLTAGSVYTFTVSAVNAVGTSTASAQSNSVVPYAVPAAPVITSATASTSAANLTWTAPAANGSPITSYVVTPYIGATAQATQSFSGSTTSASITGLTPGTAYTFTVTAVNAAGAGPASAPSTTVTPNASPTLTFPAPPAGEIGVAYGHQLPVNNGTSPFTWSVASGTLPTGITLSSGGLLSGTPTAAGTYNFTVQVLDGSGQTATRAVSLVIAAAPVVTFAPTPGEVTVAYSQQPTVTGGVSPFSWAISTGTLPPGLSIDASTGLISGTPTTSGSFAVTVSATDNLGQTASKAVTLAIAAVPSLTSVPPAGQSGEPYTFTFVATGGNGPFVYSVVAGSLPSGFTLTSGGVLSGSSSVVANTSFTVKVVDAAGLSATDAVTLVIGPSPVQVVKTADSTTTTPGSVVRFTVTVTNSSTTRTFNGAQVVDPLADITDDAVYNNDAVVTEGTVTKNPTNLQWNLTIAPSSTTTLTYTVTVANPGSGNKVMTGTLSTSFLSTNCNPGSQTSDCTATVTISALNIVKSADVATTTPGSTVRFTIVVTNSGQSTYPGAGFADSLSGVLDDATYNNDVSTTVGTTSYAGSTLTWSGSLAAGASSTITYTVTVKNPDTGNKILNGTVVSSTPGSTCPAGNPAASCTATVTVLIPGLTITKSANTPTVQPGGTVNYTIVVANTGETSYPAATFTDSLAEVLSDATYAGGANATTGSLSYTADTLAWTGALAPGASATISYSVTVRDPDPGDKTMNNTVVSASVGSNCPSGSGDARCTANVNVLVPGLTIVKTSTSATTTPGATVAYTVKVTNSGDTSYASANFADWLAGVQDDATYNGDIAYTSGSASVTGDILGWSGSLAVGAAATITYSVTVHAADGGDNLLTNTVTSTSTGVNCLAGSSDARCAVTVPVARLVIQQLYVGTTTTPGSVLTLSATFTNTGQVPYTGITVYSPGADTLDDGIPTGNQTASSGTLSVDPDGITWTGSIPVGGVVTVSGGFTIKNPDPGNQVFTTTWISAAPGNNCPASSTDPRCTTRLDVLTPGLTITKTASTTAVEPGGSIVYTVTVHNTGQTAYTSAVVTDAMAGALDDASYGANAVVTGGSVSYAAPNLTWTGDLAVGATVTITYSMTALTTVGNDKDVRNTVTSTDVGSTCPPGNTNTACVSNVAVLTPGLTLTKTADLTNPTLGATVTYTVLVANTGQTTYPAATFDDALAGVLDDASYNAGDTTASTGTTAYANGVLSWTGTLSPGDSATITYALSVRSPSSGDRDMTNTVVSSSAGSNCATGSSDTRCTVTVNVTNAVTLTFAKTASTATTVPGGVLTYTVTVVNSSVSPIVGADFTDSLAATLDDASYNNDAVASSGSVDLTGSDLTWVGSVPAGATVTVTYSVTTSATKTGNDILSSVLSSGSILNSNNCLAGSGDTRCASTVPVARLDLHQYATETTTTPGSLVHVTQTFINTGQSPYYGITVTSPRADTSDDAVPTGDETVSSGNFVRTPTEVSWTGDIAVGATVTITRTLQVKDPDPGNQLIRATLSSTAPGSNCPSGTADARCSFSITVLTPGLTISKTANRPYATPGDTVDYTITVHNTGQTAYVGAAVSDSLVGVLDDAVYGGATATIGSTSYASPTLSWSGNLAVGQTAVITYSVTVNSPAAGDKVMVNRVSSTTVGSTCLPASGNAACAATVPVLTPALTITAAANASTAAPGDTVTYTLVAANTGQTFFPAATFNTSLADLSDDAVYNANAATTDGGVSVTGGTLTWTGALAPGSSATVTFSVTIPDPVPGNHRLAQTVTSTTTGSNCATGGSDPRCTTSVPITSLLITSTANVTTAKPTDVVQYTSTFTNTGQVPYTAVSVFLDTPAAIDDATYNGDATATSGSVTLTSASRIRWTGDLAVGATVTFTASVTVKNPDPGDKLITTATSSDAVGSNCPPGNTAQACTTTVTVFIPVLSISKTADRTEVVGRGMVGYVITAKNTGETNYANASLTDSLAGVLDDAAYNNDVNVTSGDAAYANGTLSWNGPLAMGEEVVISYTVTVAVSPAGNSDSDLRNRVESATVGSTCPTGTTSSACRTSTMVSASYINLTGLTPSFTLTGPPGTTVTTNGAVQLNVDTNSLGGYNVTVKGSGGPLQPLSAGNADEIPLDHLRVRQSGSASPFQPMSDQNPFIVHQQSGRSAPGGDAISDDYQVDIPFVASDTYSTTLEYVAVAE